MIGVKGGTQTWSKSEQKVDYASDNRRTISADQQNQFFGDQDIGQVLNKVADPNYVDPSKQVRKVGNQAMDKDAFMKLLLTQMKFQDPTNPMQSHEMAAQLAQFTSLEKLTNINDGISSLTKAQAPAQNFEALSLIGKAVAGDSAVIDRKDITESHEIPFQLKQDAQQAEVEIKDLEGKTIRTLQTANLKTGRNEITWNGKNDQGQDAAPGSYTVIINAKASNGQKLGADTKFEGIITGINFTPQGPVLMIGKQAVALRDVKQIIDPSFVKPVETQKLEVKNDPAAGPNGAKSSVKAASNQPKQLLASNLDSVGMSQNFINKLNKEGAKAGGY